ncbi:hypothetical protein BH10ACT10_BH10ACT10_20460 [soil metagenome]
MSVDVRQQLDRLAQDAPTGGPPSDLWQRGVRRRRRRLAGGAAACVLAVLVGGGLAGTVVALAPTPTVVPAAGDGAAIPDRLVQPDPWTAGTDRKGPPGRLAVVAGAARKSGILGTARDGLVGVTAARGEYRFLDLQGALADSTGMLGTDQPVALSPDGRQVAYWRGADGCDAADCAATGIAAYDTASGRVRSQDFPSPQGLAPESLSWVSDDTVLVRYGVITHRDASSMSTDLGPSRLWTPRTGGLSKLANSLDNVDRVSPTADGFTSWNGHRLTLWTTTGTSYTSRTVRVTGLDPQAPLGSLAVSPDGSRVVLVSEQGSQPSQLYVGRLTEQSTRLTVTSLGTRAVASSVVGWRDVDHVLVQAAVGSRSGVYAVDATTGVTEPAVDVPELNYTPGQVYATDLWGVPTLTRPGPPDVLDPQAASAGGVVLAVVLLLVAARVRRRRVLG